MVKLRLGETHYIQEYQIAAKRWMTIAGATSGYNAEIICMALQEKFKEIPYRAIEVPK